MGWQDQLIQQVTDLTNYVNRIASNSKRIDELPNANTGTKWVAVWNATTGATQKQSRDAFVDQNNIPYIYALGALPGNGVATSQDVAVRMTGLGVDLVINEKQTPVVIVCTKINGTSNIKYIFLFRRGKGNWVDIVYNPGDFYLIGQMAVTAADINPGPNVQIDDIGEIADQNAFLAAANADAHAFTNPDITYYISYSILENEGTPLEQLVLYLAQFVGTNGTYGGASPDDFVEEDFVDTYSTGEQYVTNQDNITKVKTFSYTDSMSLSAIVTALNSLESYTVNEYETIIFRGTNSVFPTRFKKFRMINKGKGTYGVGGTALTTSDIELIYESPFRLDVGKIVKLGKGYQEDMAGVITTNTGPFELDEKGDFFAAVGPDGFVYPAMRYGGTGSAYDFANLYYEQSFKISIPGEPNYSG